jgi:hypothetical protein
MKKPHNALLPLLTLLAVATLVSCQSPARSFGTGGATEDERVKVLADPRLEILAIDGKPYTPQANPFHKPVPLVFDPGSHTFRLRYNSKTAIFRTLTDAVDLACDFQKGKSYQVYARFTDAESVIIDYMEIELRDDERKLFGR